MFAVPEATSATAEAEVHQEAAVAMVRAVYARATGSEDDNVSEQNGKMMIPSPDTVNKRPVAGDVWFNYRSLQEVNVVAVDEERVVMTGARSGKGSSTRIDDFAQTRFFRFLRHEEAPVEVPVEVRPRETVMAQLLAEQKLTNAKLDRAIEVLEQIVRIYS